MSSVTRHPYTNVWFEKYMYLIVKPLLTMITLSCSAYFNLYPFPSIAISAGRFKLEPLFHLGQCDSYGWARPLQHILASQARQDFVTRTCRTWGQMDSPGHSLFCCECFLVKFNVFSDRELFHVRFNGYVEPPALIPDALCSSRMRLQLSYCKKWFSLEETVSFQTPQRVPPILLVRFCSFKVFTTPFVNSWVQSIRLLKKTVILMDFSGSNHNYVMKFINCYNKKIHAI